MPDRNIALRAPTLGLIADVQTHSTGALQYMDMRLGAVVYPQRETRDYVPGLIGCYIQ